MDADRQRWDQRWTEAGPADAAEVAPRAPDVLEAYPDLVGVIPHDGPGLDVACGVGAQSLWMVERGLDVTAIDVSPVAIDLVRAAATSRGLRITADVVDTDQGLPAELTELALIVCQRFRAQHLDDEFVARLRPGGIIVHTVLSTVGLDGDGGPFHAPPGELVDAYRSSNEAAILLHVEHAGQASIVVRRC